MTSADRIITAIRSDPCERNIKQARLTARQALAAGEDKALLALTLKNAVYTEPLTIKERAALKRVADQIIYGK